MPPEDAVRRKSPQLDAADWKILRFMQRNPEAPIAEVAEAINLSTSPCWRRVQRLKVEGVLRGQRVDLDPRRLGLNCTVYAFVKLANPGHDQWLAFEQHLSSMEEVVSCERVTGAIDYLIKVVTTDVQGYDDFLRYKLLKGAAISDVESHIVVSQSDIDPSLPLGVAEDSTL